VTSPVIVGADGEESPPPHAVIAKATEQRAALTERDRSTCTDCLLAWPPMWSDACWWGARGTVSRRGS